MNAFPPAPTPADENYATCRVEMIIGIDADRFFDWYMDEPVQNFMLGTMIVPAVTGTVHLPGPAWREPGATRIIHFKDGSHSLERILSADWPRAYSYQPWAYTNPVRLLSDYAVATMTALPEGVSTRIVWDYGFHARHGWARPTLQAFVDYGWKRNLEGGLKVMKAHLETHGTSRRIHDAAKAA